MINLLFTYHLIFIILACRVKVQSKNYPGEVTDEAELQNYASQKKTEKLIVEK